MTGYGSAAGELGRGCSVRTGRRCGVRGAAGLDWVRLDWVRRGRVWLGACTLAGLLVLAAPVWGDEPPSAVGPLLKLYRSGKLPADRQPAVVEMICTRGNEHDLRVVLDKVLEPGAMPAAVRLKALQGLAEAAATRKLKPAGDLRGVTGLMAEPDPAQRLAALKLVGACGVTEAAPVLGRLALDAQGTAEVRQGAIGALVALRQPESRKVLEQLAAGTDGLPLRMQAVAGLTEFDLPVAAEWGARVLASAGAADNPTPLLAAFFNRKEGSAELAKALGAVQLPVDVAKRALRSMYAIGRSDAELSNVLSTAAGIAADAPPPTPEEIAKIVADVTTHGDPARGEEIFRRVDLSCMRCHSVSRAGGQVGPELSAVGGSSPVDYVANSILNPNLAVKEQYVTRVFELESGKVLSGVVVDRDETRVRVRDSQGQLVVIPTAEIEEESEGPSMMPMGLTKFLTRGELLDLIRFVSELGRPGAYAVQTVPRVQRWQQLLRQAPELTDEVPSLDGIRELLLENRGEDWASVYGKVAGDLPLGDLVLPEGGARPKSVILRGEVQVNEAGEVGVTVSSEGRVQAWLDAEPLLGDAPWRVRLEPGRHWLTVRVELPANGGGSVRAELTRPEGTTAQFEVVGGQ